MQRGCLTMKLDWLENYFARKRGSVCKRVWNKRGQIKLTGFYVPWDFSSSLRRRRISKLCLSMETHPYRPGDTYRKG